MSTCHAGGPACASWMRSAATRKRSLAVDSAVRLRRAARLGRTGTANTARLATRASLIHPGLRFVSFFAGLSSPRCQVLPTLPPHPELDAGPGRLTASPLLRTRPCASLSPHSSNLRCAPSADCQRAWPLLHVSSRSCELSRQKKLKARTCAKKQQGGRHESLVEP